MCITPMFPNKKPALRGAGGFIREGPELSAHLWIVHFLPRFTARCQGVISLFAKKSYTIEIAQTSCAAKGKITQPAIFQLPSPCFSMA